MDQAEGKAKPSFTSTLLQEVDSTNDYEQESLIRDCAAVAYGGGCCNIYAS